MSGFFIACKAGYQAVQILKLWILYIQEYEYNAHH